MANTITRRPLPALVSLVALLALTGIVWWRVLNRDTGGSTDAGAKPAPSTCTSAAAAPTRTLPAPSTITVKVLNSTSKSGIAGKARDTLLADGFKVPAQAGNDSVRTPITASAEIRYGSRGQKGAELLRYYFPGAAMKPQTNAFVTVTVSLGAGYTSVATSATVKASLARDRVALESATPTSPASGSATSAAAAPTC